jgi:hypothetical protein
MMFGQDLLNENFGTGTGVTTFPENWILGPNTNETHNWQVATMSGTGNNANRGARSLSRTGSTGLTPNNFLISPIIDFDTDGKDYMLRFDYRIGDAGARGAAERLGVYLISATTDLTAGNIETLPWPANDEAVNTGTHNHFSHILWDPPVFETFHRTFRTITLDLTAVSGQHRIAFRHYDCTDILHLDIDNVIVREIVPAEITTGGDISIASFIIPVNINSLKTSDFSITLNNVGVATIPSFKIEIMESETPIAFTDVSVPLTMWATETYIVELPILNHFGNKTFFMRVTGDNLTTRNTANTTVLLFNQSEGHELQTTIDHYTPTTSNDESLPIWFRANVSLSQTIYRQSEIGAKGFITHLRYFYNHDDDCRNEPITIYLKQTPKVAFGAATSQQHDMESNDPPDSFDIVFSGTLDLPITAATGQSVWIPLNTPFFYDPESTDGENLMIMVFRQATGFAAPAARNWRAKTLTAAQGGIVRSARIGLTGGLGLTPLDMMQGWFATTINTVPIVHFLIDRSDVVELTGIITDQTTSLPIAGVRVKNVTSGISVLTNEAGVYYFPALIIDNNLGISTYHTLYKDNTPEALYEGNVTVNDMIWSYNIVLEAYPLVSVYGAVFSGWDGNPLIGASVTLTHPDGTEFKGTTVETDARPRNDRDTTEAVFKIDVPENQLYQLTISANNFQDYIIEDLDVPLFSVSDDLWIDDVMMIEDFKSPIYIQVASRQEPLRGISRRSDETQTVYDVEWFNPLTPSSYASHAGNPSSSHVGFTNGTWMWVAHRWTKAQREAIGLQGKSIYRISYVPFASPDVTTAFVELFYNPVSEPTFDAEEHFVYDQFIEGQFVVAGGWTSVDLEELILIDGDGDWWITIYMEGTAGNPRMYVDSGPNVPQSGGMYFSGSAWIEWTTSNFCIAAFAVEDTRTPPTVARTITPLFNRNIQSLDATNQINVVQSNIEIAPKIIPSSYDFVRGRPEYRAIVGYNVYRIFDVEANYHTDPPSIDHLSPINGSSVVTETKFTDNLAGAVGAFRYAVTAVYNTPSEGIFHGISAPTYSLYIVDAEDVEVTIFVANMFGLEIEDANVSLTRIGGGENQYIGKTDASGLLILSNVAYGQYRLAVDATGFLPFFGVYNIYGDRYIEVYLNIGDPEKSLVFESFENPESFPPSRWLNLDLDGDGYFFRNYIDYVEVETAYHGNHAIFSQSFCMDSEVAAGCLYPDNWIITPPINLAPHMKPTISFAAKSAGQEDGENLEFLTIYAITDREFVMIGEWSWPPSPFDTHEKQVEYLKTLLSDESESPIKGHWPFGDLKEDKGIKLFDEEIDNIDWELRVLRSEEFDMLTGRVRLAFRHWQSMDNHYLGLDLIRVDWEEFPRVRLSGVVYDETLYLAAREAILRGEEPPVYAIEGAVVTIEAANGVSTTVTTDADGTFITAAGLNFRPGYSYILTITADDYKTLIYPDLNKGETVFIPHDGILNEGEPLLMKNMLLISGLVGHWNKNQPFMPPTQIQGATIVIEREVGSVWEEYMTFTSNEIGRFGSRDEPLLPAASGNFRIRVSNIPKQNDEEYKVIEIGLRDFWTFEGFDPDSFALDVDLSITIMVSPIISDVDYTIIPLVTELVGNHPNPFNPVTTINFNTVSEGNVKIEIFNIKGQRVTTLVDRVIGAGKHSVVWKGVDANNRSVGSGVYFYRMTTEGYTATQKMLLIK